MPSAYAHLRFGNDVLDRLPPELAGRVRPYGALFRLGLIGPDFLFFYRPYFPNRVIPLGRRIHADAGIVFFARGAAAYRRSGCSPEYFAYLCGAVCHFALDSGCHGCITAYKERCNVGHFELEESFDRALMRYDGMNADRYVLSGLRVSREDSAVMASFYRDMSPEKIRRSVRSAADLGAVYHVLRSAAGRGACAALCSDGRRRRKAALKRGRSALARRYRASVKTAARLLLSLEDSARGSAPWDDAYNFNFAGERVF